MQRGILLLALVGAVAATTGWDGIQAVSESGFKCLSNAGYKFFIARVWESIGNYDTTGIQNIKNARAAGITGVDGYIFPCTKSSCAAPANQVKAVIDRLKQDGAHYGMLWLDIEILSWPADQTHNRNFIDAMANELDSQKVNWGIYTNAHNWGSIVGLDWTKYSHKQLWWATYNGHQDFTGYQPFAGWTKPAIHQYSGSVNGPCGVNMDQNWYP